MSNTWWREPDELIDEQSNILDIDENASFRVIGPPGSGKTNLLVLRANYLYLGTKPNLVLIVVGSVLKDFLIIGGAQYKFPTTKVKTHSRFFNDILRENDVKVPGVGTPYLEAREYRAQEVFKLIEQKKIDESAFDAILLDEAQDYLPIEIEIFSKLSKVIIATADSRQRVYDTPDPLSHLESCVPDMRTLNFHFRNGRAICKLADGLMKGKPEHVSMLASSNYDESQYPSSVDIKSSLDINKQAAAIHEQLNRQLSAYPEELIGILCPTNEAVAAIYSYLRATDLSSQITLCGSDDFDSSKPIWLSTISSAKGLEFRAVHLAGLDSISKSGPAQRRIMFTGVTRAKTSLVLYYDESIPGYLETAIREVLPQSKVITKNRLFGKAD